MRRAFTVSRSIGNKAVSTSTIARAWGSASPAGKILSYMTALREYGLTQEAGRGETRRIQLTELGFQLVRQNPPRELLTTAALSPPPFRELWTRVRTGRSADQNEIMQILCAGYEKKGLLPFTERGALEAFRIFRTNVEYVGLNDDDDPLDDRRESNGQPEAIPPISGQEPQGIAAREYLEFRVPLSSGRDAKFLYPNHPSKEELEQLKVMLQGVQVIIDGLSKA